MAVAAPPVISRPFARDAALGYIQNPLPVSTADPERADWNLGFKPLSMTPIIAGGVPPHGQDMNGVLYAATANIVYLSAGQLYQYNSDISAAIGGYAKGCTLGAVDGNGIWFNTQANNVTDPDAGGAGWVAMFNYGQASVPTAGGTVLLTPAQYRSRVIVLTGVLGANAALKFPDGSLQSWLIVNNTTGAFSVTASTVSGVELVAIPPGGWAGPVGVYSNASELYPTVAPLGVAISQAPDPLTLVQRTNNGFATATYHQQSSPLEVLTASALWFETADDGFIRKSPLTNIADQLFPLFSPTKLLASNGYLKLPGGLILQWGFTQGAAGIGDLTVVFPLAFPNACFNVLAVGCNRTGGDKSTYVNGFSAATATINADVQNTGIGAGFRAARWFAVGY